MVFRKAVEDVGVNVFDFTVMELLEICDVAAPPTLKKSN